MAASLKWLTEVTIVFIAVLVFVLRDDVKPAQLCLCGLVGCSITMVREL
jgi:uncharacterized membrane protein YjjB (DUF3815 family)